jgi:hypothetical protein
MLILFGQQLFDHIIPGNYCDLAASQMMLLLLTSESYFLYVFVRTIKIMMMMVIAKRL